MLFADLLILIFASAASLNEGDLCRTSSRQGICRKLADCPVALHNLQEKGVVPKVCAFKGLKAFVCCENQQSSAFPILNENKNPVGNESEDKNPDENESEDKNPDKDESEDQDVREKYGEQNTEKEEAGWIATEKCLDYGSWRQQTALKERTCRAGLPPYIFGGIKAARMEFAHMAHIGYGEEIDSLSWECGGSLISERYILTAGHCMNNNDGHMASHVRLGSEDPESTFIIQVQAIFPHPKYNPPQVYHDISLLRLIRQVDFNFYVRPACLQVERNFSKAVAIASGWGRTEYSGGNNSDYLMQVCLPFMEHEECLKTYGSRAGSSRLPQGLQEDLMLCAGELDSNKDACNGDSGGPLQIPLTTPYCMYSVVGITSFGIGCGIAPGVYTRVSHYVPWIESVVWPAKEILP